MRQSAVAFGTKLQWARKKATACFVNMLPGGSSEVELFREAKEPIHVSRLARRRLTSYSSVRMASRYRSTALSRATCIAGRA